MEKISEFALYPAVRVAMALPAMAVEIIHPRNDVHQNGKAQEKKEENKKAVHNMLCYRFVKA